MIGLDLLTDERKKLLETKKEIDKALEAVEVLIRLYEHDKPKPKSQKRQLLPQGKWGEMFDDAYKNVSNHDLMTIWGHIHKKFKLPETKRTAFYTAHRDYLKKRGKK